MANILVSACLLGCPCRYTGDGCLNGAILALAKAHTLIPVCPEQLGGLATPRPPAERQGDRVISAAGEDVTEPYRKGAQTVVEIAKLSHVALAIMKARSPSCGYGVIYDGTFTGTRISGSGVAAELLSESGIPVFTEEELDAVRVQLLYGKIQCSQN